MRDETLEAAAIVAAHAYNDSVSSNLTVVTERMVEAMRDALTAALPRIEADLREQIAAEIETAIPADGRRRAAHYISATRRAVRIARRA